MPGPKLGAGFGGLWSGQRCGDRDWGPGPGAGKWEGSGPGPFGAAMGRVPGADAARGRGVVPGAECGPVADAGRGALRVPGGAAAISLAGAARPSK